MRSRLLGTTLLFFTVLGSACASAREPADPAQDPGDGPVETSILAGGCFWCVESAFDGVEGVFEAVSGYTGGPEAEATYSQVSSGTTSHVEAVRVRYDPTVIDYERVLDIFWRQIDPTDPGGQFADRGGQYRTGIYYGDERQREIAEQSKAELERSGRFESPIVTPILPAGKFFVAEEYHQNYHLKHPAEYKRYRYGSGRTPFLEKVWGADAHAETGKPDAFVKPPEPRLRETLTPLQFRVTQEDDTERPFDNEYWDNKEEGLYVDVVSGEPLFSSIHKFKSGSGWPSFTQPIDSQNIVEKIDYKLGMKRTEVRSRKADSHLGHLFPDGPEPTRLRYCINSAALRFVPKQNLEKEGYGKYLALFE